MTEIFDLTFEQTSSAAVSAPIERSEWWLHPLLSLLGCGTTPPFGCLQQSGASSTPSAPLFIYPNAAGGKGRDI